MRSWRGARRTSRLAEWWTLRRCWLNCALVVKLRISEEAQADIERIDAWWQEHRDKNPWLFQDELAEALELIELSPRLGRIYEGAHSYRWVLLLKSRYLVFYEHFPEEDLVAIVAVWSSRRGEAPPLK